MTFERNGIDASGEKPGASIPFPFIRKYFLMRDRSQPLLWRLRPFLFLWWIQGLDDSAIASISFMLSALPLRPSASTARICRSQWSSPACLLYVVALFATILSFWGRFPPPNSEREGTFRPHSGNIAKIQFRFTIHPNWNLFYRGLCKYTISTRWTPHSYIG